MSCYISISFIQTSVRTSFVVPPKLRIEQPVKRTKAYKFAFEDLSAPRTAVKEAAEAYALAHEMFPHLAEGTPDPRVTAADKTYCDVVCALMSTTEKAEKKKT